MVHRHSSGLAALAAALIIAPVLGRPADAQTTRAQWEGVPSVRLPEDPYLLHTADEPSILVRVLTTGLSHPWSLAFLPNGDMLVTEREGRLRIIRHGVLDPTPVAGVPDVSLEGQFTGLLEVALHPRYAENRLIYLTYRTASESRVALARAMTAPPCVTCASSTRRAVSRSPPRRARGCSSRRTERCSCP